MSRFVPLDVEDVRFPTSRELDGSDAMNPDLDYSTAYVVLRTDDGLDGHGFAFTIGRGNDVQCAAISLLAEHVVGRDVEAVCADPGGFSRSLLVGSPLRWLGSGKGVMHMAVGAVVNAAWTWPPSAPACRYDGYSPHDAGADRRPRRLPLPRRRAHPRRGAGLVARRRTGPGRSCRTAG